MSPHSANDETNDSKKSQKSKNIEGEISIDHSPKQPKTEINVTESAPAHHQPEPAKTPEPAPETQKPADTKPAGVVVPGGVSASAPNPSTYFRSKYRGGAAKTPTAQHPLYGQNTPAYPTHGGPAAAGTANRRKLFGIIGVTALVLLIIFGYIFGVYIPNKPENVYANGLDRTGKALDKILDNGTRTGTLDKLFKSEGTGNFEAKVNDETITGTVTTKMDRGKVNLDVDAVSKVAGKSDLPYKVSALADLSSGSTNPAIYFKSDGLGFLGLEGLIPTLVNYDGKWISIQGDYAKMLVGKYAASIGDQLAPGPLGSATGSAASMGDISNQDIADAVKQLSDITRTYLFTKDTTKAVLTNKEYVGKEDTEAGKAYHYKVGINKDNYGEYCKALSNSLIDSKLYQHLIGIDSQSVANEKTNSEAACDQSKDEIKSTDVLDIWIDAKYKVIYKIQFTDSQDTSSYFEVGQNYKGKDNLQLFYNYNNVAEKSESHGVYNVNFKTAESEIRIDLSSGGDSDKSSLVLNMTTKPFDGDVQVNAPADATPLQTITKQTGQDLKSLIDPDVGLVPTNKAY